ncbi:DNA polymerase domain-containing protein [Natrialbaceae archaeon GCM10025810]|uniref:DNA polymerase domain-containing protein n=1 Tax=Halovalidus salilacus TaxID=3075124 RepID=UPI003623A2BB
MSDTPDSSPYTFEFDVDGGAVREWHLTDDGAEPRLVDDYAPSLFASGPDDALADLRERLESDPKVLGTRCERWATNLHEHHRDERTRPLRVDLERVDEVYALAREVRGVHERENYAPGTFRLFDVDLDPGFRYCLDRGLDPTPARDLRTLEVTLEEPALTNRDLSALRIDGEPVSTLVSGAGDPADVDVLRALHRRLERIDPDALVLSRADLVPILEGAAEACGLDEGEFHLGRLPGWTRIAGANTYESYGQVGHSPARYRVPGRAIVDRSNSFLWHQSGLEGIRYMVAKTGRPLQEAAWGSIGTLLTSRQIRLAREEGVLAPWNKWEPERFADVRTLHDADRGGFTFAPEVGFHEEVHEIDFASLYPRIIRERNVSPETVDCADLGCPRPARDRVPGLEYEICEREGFLPEVLEGLLADRAERKERLATEADLPDDEAARLRAESGAIKWVLVSCFGYQGYRNAKFGRIECHEAINAYAREIALEAKARLEAGGWRIVHGIVDSLWVTPDPDRDGDPEPLAAVTADVSESVGIPLERDGSYEWVCFVPLRESGGSGGSTQASDANSSAAARPGALTKYFGKRRTEESDDERGDGVGNEGGSDERADGNEGDGNVDGDGGGGGEGDDTDARYKFRGLECRQRSTPPFVADCQREFVEALDRERDPAAVCDVLRRRLADLREGAIDPAELVITSRASRRLSEYRQRTRTVAALQRYERHGVDRHPGQSVEYVVVDDERRGPERVRLAFELEGAGDGAAAFDAPRRAYDADFYADLLIRACESVVSPLGWTRRRIRRYLRDGHAVRLSTFAE